MKSSLLSIGEASKLKNVSIKALRYYEKIGIFPPAHIALKAVTVIILQARCSILMSS